MSDMQVFEPEFKAGGAHRVDLKQVMHSTLFGYAKGRQMPPIREALNAYNYVHASRICGCAGTPDASPVPVGSRVQCRVKP